MARKSKKAKAKAGRASSTKGILKGENCRKSPLKTQLAKDTRMHKTCPDQFAQVSEIVNRLNR